MRQRRWLAIGGAAMVLAAGAALGLSNSSVADEPVRVFLVHGLIETPRTGTTTMTNDGITVVIPGNFGNTWPTQVVGYLHDIEDDWVILRKAEGKERLEMRIPRERVQLIEHVSEERLRSLLTPG